MVGYFSMSTLNLQTLDREVDEVQMWNNIRSKVVCGFSICFCLYGHVERHLNCSNIWWPTSLHYIPVGLDRCLPWISKTEEFGWTITAVSHFCHTFSHHSLTSSPTQNSPAVCFRMGSRAGKWECVTAEEMWEWKLSTNVIALAPPTLKAVINEVLSPLHLLCSDFLSHT